jgi:hypothetical protein
MFPDKFDLMRLDRLFPDYMYVVEIPHSGVLEVRDKESIAKYPKTKAAVYVIPLRLEM